MQQSESAIHAAKDYFERLRWRSIPIHSIRNGKCTCGRTCRNPGKHAAVSWKNAHKWFDPFQGFNKSNPGNLGILTGAPSNLVVIDIDVDKGGFDSLETLKKRFGPLDDHTLTVSTGGGGRHIYYSYTGGKVSNGVNVLGSGIDLRGDGGYVLAPPSIHRTERIYQWENGLHQPATLPAELIDALSEPRIRSGSGDCIPRGERNDSLFRYACKLRGEGKEKTAILNQIHQYNITSCRPPLVVDEVSRIALSACRYEPGANSQCYEDAWIQRVFSESGPGGAGMRAVLTVLWQFMKKHGGICYPSQELIAECAGIRSTNTVRKHLRNAEAEGWILAYSRIGQNGNSSIGYVANIPPPIQTAA